MTHDSSRFARAQQPASADDPGDAADLPEGEHRTESRVRLSPLDRDAPADRRETGVGPWPGGPEAWPADPRYDRELLAGGDRRNVVDRYRYWSVEAIRADLGEKKDPGAFTYKDLGIMATIGRAAAFLGARPFGRLHKEGWTALTKAMREA